VKAAVRVTTESLTPMQAFYPNNGFEAPECIEAPPSLLLVQGTREMPIDITANGADIRASSTFILRVLPPGDIMQLIVLDGLVILYPDTPNEILLPPGFATTICLSEERDLGIDGRENDREVDCVWSAPRMLTREELAALAPLEDVPENVMVHPVFVPSIITASGVGGTIDRLIFDTLEALTAAREACLEGRLSAEICEHLGL
jgi:hypothetical protein